MQFLLGSLLGQFLISGTQGRVERGSFTLTLSQNRALLDGMRH